MNCAELLTDLLSSEHIKHENFSGEFLAQFPVAQLAVMLTGIKESYGAFYGVDQVGADFVLRFERAKVPTQITLNTAGQIIGLWLEPAIAEGDIQSHIASIAALPGQTSILVVTDGKTIGAHLPDVPLAVASAGKLAVLVALKRLIANGSLAWDRVVYLDPRWKSLPSGQLQDWPNNTPLTIATLAHLMISVSDNTATDALINIIGRTPVEAISPRNSPFITTRETFILQAEAYASLRAQWNTSDVRDRLTILESIQSLPLPAVGVVAAHEIGWHISGRELCELLDEASDLPSVGINPGLAARKDWAKVAYKGGSDTGALNLSSRLVDKAGSIHVVIATWNNDAVLSDDKFIAAYRGILSQLA